MDTNDDPFTMNYPTTLVGLYLDGNYDGAGTYRKVRELVRNAAESASDETRRVAVGDALREWFEDRLPALEGIAADLLNGAVSEVDWRELAEHKLQEISETVS